MSDPDLVLAYRYLYYCEAISFVPDNVYDQLEKQARKDVDDNHLLNRPGSDRKEDYPPEIRALALYLRLKYSKRLRGRSSASDSRDKPLSAKKRNRRKQGDQEALF